MDQIDFFDMIWFSSDHKFCILSNKITRFSIMYNQFYKASTKLIFLF